MWFLCDDQSPLTEDTVRKTVDAVVMAIQNLQPSVVDPRSPSEIRGAKAAQDAIGG